MRKITGQDTLCAKSCDSNIFRLDYRPELSDFCLCLYEKVKGIRRKSEKKYMDLRILIIMD